MNCFRNVYNFMHKVLTKHLPEEFYRKIKIAQTIYQDFKKLTEKSGPQFMQFIVIIYHAQKIAMHAVHYTQYTRHFKIFRPKICIFSTPFMITLARFVEFLFIVSAFHINHCAMYWLSEIRG